MWNFHAHTDEVLCATTLESGVLLDSNAAAPTGNTDSNFHRSKGSSPDKTYLLAPLLKHSFCYRDSRYSESHVFDR